MADSKEEDPNSEEDEGGDVDEEKQSDRDNEDSEESESEVDEDELRAKYGPGLVETREKRATAGKRFEHISASEAYPMLT